MIKVSRVYYVINYAISLLSFTGRAKIVTKKGEFMWRILVVDDDFVSRKLIVEMLKGKAECDVAASGMEAIEAYNVSVREDHLYDLILLDISMPDIEGIEVLRRIRENEEKAGIMLGEGIPIIMVTAHEAPVMRAFNRGCDDYMIKPINAKTLIGKIEEKLAK